MSYADHVQQAEHDLARLFRSRDDVEARLRAVAALPSSEIHPALFALTSQYPGVISLGFLLGLREADQENLIRSLWPAGELRDFVQRLLTTVQKDAGLMNGFRRLLPQTVPAEPRPPSVARSTPLPSSVTPTSGAPAQDEAIPLSEDLQRLIHKFLQSPELPSPRLATPISGHLAGTEISAADQLTLTLQDDGNLRIQGPGLNNFSRFGGDSGPGFVPAIEADAALTLSDGSELYAEIFVAEGRAWGTKNPAGSWHGVLNQWHWRKAEHVHTWAAQVQGLKLYHPDNLIIGTGAASSHGFHVPGFAGLTAVRHPTATDQHFLFVPAAHRPFESLRTTWSLLQIPAFLLGLQSPWRLCGFDAQGKLIAVAGQHRRSSVELHADQSEFMQLVPFVDRGPAGEPHYWVPVFAYHLLNDALKPQSAAYPSFLEYRSIVEMPFLEDQIAKLGAAIRILLHCEGTLRADSYLSPDGVSTALRTYARIRGVRLPEGAEASLAAAHRIALLGERGLAASAIDRRREWQSGRPVELLGTLRITYACLLAAQIGYTGPVRADDARLHSPLLNPRPEAVAEDRRLAAQRFIAEPPLPSD